MNVSIGEPWERFVEDAVQSGRYASASDVVAEGLRLVQALGSTLDDLRATLNASLDDPRPSLSADEVGAHLRRRAAAAGLGKERA